MNKKSVTVVIWFVLMLFLLSGCGVQTAGDETNAFGEPIQDMNTTSKKNEKTYKVTFFSGGSSDSENSPGQDNSSESDNGGTIAKVDAVVKHDSATPPNPETIPGKVFVKWDSDFTDVTKDIEVHAVTEDISGKPNVIAVEGAYGKHGQSVVVPISLCGEVNLSGIDLTVTYDSNALILDSVFNEDGAVVFNSDTPGIINLNYVSAENTTADVDLCSLKFSVKAESGEYEIKTQVNSVYCFKDETNLYTPEYTLIDANVYVYQ